MLKKVSDAHDPPAEKPKPKSLPPAINFLNAGLSGMAATCVVHPMDVLKNRMQMSKEGATIAQTIKAVFHGGGITKFYVGLSAGLVRQATYTTARLGIYNQLNDIWRESNPGNPSFQTLVLMAATAGSAGAFVGTPAEVALIRMTSDGRLPPEQRRNYKNVVDAFVRIIKEEGVTTLWRGSVATMGRAAIVNVSQLATYSQAKTMINKKFEIDGIGLHFSASMLSGFITAFNSMPFDIAKTRLAKFFKWYAEHLYIQLVSFLSRIQNWRSKDKPPNMVSVIVQIARTEGVTALWKGFWPTYCRIGPHTVITFIFNEQFAKAYRQIFMK